MANRVVNTMTPRMALRKHMRKVMGTKRMKLAPPSTVANRVVVRLAPGSSPEEELLLLGALRELKVGHDAIKLEYVTDSLEVFDYLKSAWFLNGFHLIHTVDQFDDLVGLDFGVTVFEPDPSAAEIAEKVRYEAAFERETASKQALQQSYIDRGMKDLIVDMPVYNFHPRWHKTNAYLWSLSDELGITLDIPFAPIAPFYGTNKYIRDSVRKGLSKASINSRPFAIYDLRGEINEVSLAATVAKALEGYNTVSIQAIEKAVGSGLGSLLSVMSDTHCGFVVAPVGDVLYTAWAAGINNILCLYTGSRYTWDGADADNYMPLERDKYDDIKLPEAISKSIEFMLERLNE